MRKLTLFIVASILFVGLTGCKHNVVTEKKLYSKTQKNEAGEIVAVTKYDKRGNVISFNRATKIGYSYEYEYDIQNRITIEKRINKKTGKSIEIIFEYKNSGYTVTEKSSTAINITEYDSEAVELYSETKDLETGNVTKKKYIKNGECGLDSWRNFTIIDASHSLLVESIIYPGDGSTEIVETSYALDEQNNYIVHDKNECIYKYSPDGLFLQIDLLDIITGDVTESRSYEYDENRDRIKAVFENGISVSIAYDKNHNIIHTLSSNGAEVTQIYDLQGNLLYQKHDTGERIQEFDNNGNKIYEKHKDFITGETSETWQEFNSDNQITYVKVNPGSSYKEQFYEYNDMKDQIYFKQINLDDSVTETVYTYDYEYY